MFDDVTENDFVPELYGPQEFDPTAAANSWCFGYSDLILRLRLEEEKLKVILNSTDKPILVIPGNHDRRAWKSQEDMFNIHCKSAKLGGYNFIGYRYCLLERTETEIENDLSLIKDLIHENTIFVSHSQPYNMLDRAHHGKLIGSKAIAEMVAERKPKFHLFGHVHESWGVRDNSVNGSYILCNGFLSIQLDENKTQIIKLRK